MRNRGPGCRVAGRVFSSVNALRSGPFTSFFSGRFHVARSSTGSKIGSIAMEIAELRRRNDQLESIASTAQHLQRVVHDQAREIDELHKALARSAKRKRQNSGPRRRDPGRIDPSPPASHSSDTATSR